ncbi:MAG: S9 family peptidase, partial [Chitinophagaceae bacterium]|nr:S9 family peptidase [Chitinophagaceae bacterium]
AQDGVVQIAMDNRSSGHFGRKGINYIFKQLGKYEIEDYIDCAKWIRSQSWADTSRIGITGGSFGGYITCMALTYGADIFTHGIAQYSVTDWKLYDSHYTERFMKTPQENPEGYRITSPINYADKYKGVLRIVHGSTDDNVHMQNSIQLIDKLENLNKSFELMIYPNQRHGIRPPKAFHNLNETIKFVNRYMLGK